MSIASFIAEARGALTGIMRLTIFDRSGLQRFAQDRAAATRSFWACVLALPTVYIPLALEFADGQVTGDPVALVLARSLGYVIGCVAFPLLSLPVLVWLGRGERWPMTIYGYNWLSLAQNTGATLLLLLQRSGALGPLTEPVAALFYLLCIAVESFMFSAVLEVGMAAPIALVLFDLILGAGIDIACRIVH